MPSDSLQPERENLEYEKETGRFQQTPQSMGHREALKESRDQMNAWKGKAPEHLHDLHIEHLNQNHN